MARIHGIALLAAIAAGTGLWIWLARPEPIAPPLPPTDTPDSAPVQPDGTRPTDPARAAVRDEIGAAGAIPSAAPAPPVGPDSVPAGTGPEPSGLAMPAVHLRVRDLVQRQPVAQFRWSFQPENRSSFPTEDLDTVKGTGEQGLAELPLPRGARGRLLIEADGLEANAQDVLVPSPLEPPLQLDLFLPPRAAASGVVLTARDPTGAPVARLRLDLWQLRSGEPPPASDCDPDGEPMWKRIGSRDDGVFELPALAPGAYALRAQPVGDDDVALPLQPCRRQFPFAGHEAPAFDVTFRPGVVLRIDAADDGGPPVDVRVVVASGSEPVPVWWSCRRGDSRPAVSLDSILLPGRATSLLALPPLPYSLELRRGEQVLALQPAPATDAGVRAFAVALPR